MPIVSLFPNRSISSNTGFFNKRNNVSLRFPNSDTLDVSNMMGAESAEEQILLVALDWANFWGRCRMDWHSC